MDHPIARAALSCGLLFAATQGVAATTLSFEDLTPGTLLSGQYAGLGAIFSANAFSGPGSSSSGLDWATNTDMTIVDVTGSDAGDPGGPAVVSGMVLRSFDGWVAEDGDPSFRISFGTPVNRVSVSFAGVDLTDDVRLFAFNGALPLGMVSGPTCASTCQFTLIFLSPTMTSVVVAPGSAFDWVAVDNVVFQPVPEPGPVALLTLGLGSLALRRVRGGGRLPRGPGHN